MALSAPLLTRKRVIKVKVETTKGTQIATDQAILVFDLEIDPTAPYIERKGTGLYRGHMETGILAERSGSCSFKAELRGTGSQGMETGLAILLQACGVLQTVEVYTLHSTVGSDKCITIDVWEDGIKKSLAGCAGNVTFDGETGGPMMCNFEFFGRWIAPTDEAMPAYVPSTVAPMKLAGGTFTIGGESIKIGRYSLNLGNNVVMRPDVDSAGGIIHYMVTDYDPVLSMDPEADKVAGYDFNGLWLAGTEAAVSQALTDGTDTITFSTPKVQIRELKGGDRDGIKIYDYTGQCNHDSGNDALSIAVT